MSAGQSIELALPTHCRRRASYADRSKAVGGSQRRRNSKSPRGTVDQAPPVPDLKAITEARNGGLERRPQRNQAIGLRALRSHYRPRFSYVNGRIRAGVRRRTRPRAATPKVIRTSEVGSGTAGGVPLRKPEMPVSNDTPSGNVR